LNCAGIACRAAYIKASIAIRKLYVQTRRGLGPNRIGNAQQACKHYKCFEIENFHDFIIAFFIDIIEI
jgi:hypothetical protein